MACERDRNGREPLDDLVDAEILEGKARGTSRQSIVTITLPIFWPVATYTTPSAKYRGRAQLPPFERVDAPCDVGESLIDAAKPRGGKGDPTLVRLIASVD
jgi:hypothetical protein